MVNFIDVHVAVQLSQPHLKRDCLFSMVYLGRDRAGTGAKDGTGDC